MEAIFDWLRTPCSDLKLFLRYRHDKACKIIERQAIFWSCQEKPKVTFYKQNGQGAMFQEKSKGAKIWENLDVSRKSQQKPMEENDFKTSTEWYTLSHLKSGVSMDATRPKAGRITGVKNDFAKNTEDHLHSERHEVSSKAFFRPITYKLDQTSREGMTGRRA